MIHWIKPRLADVLTGFRLYAALPLFLLLVFGHWTAALVLLLVMALSDALDGWAARQWKPVEKHSHDLDTRADGAMCVAVVAGVATRLALADWNDWREAYMNAWFVIAIAVLTGLGTATFVWLTGRLEPVKAERVDVVHGVYYALLVMACIAVVGYEAVQGRDESTRGLIGVLIGSALVIVLFLKRDRLKGRPDAHYPGNRTWKTLFSRA